MTKQSRSVRTRAPRDRFVAVLLAMTALFCAAPPCFPHAVVVESSPRDRAELEKAPRQIELRFNVRVEQALARASLRSGSAAPVALSLRRTSGQSDRLIVPLPPLGPGPYELRYQVLAADGHTTQGVLRFRVLP